MTKPIQTDRTGFFLMLYLQEVDPPPLSVESRLQIVRALMDNPYNKPVEMDFDRKNKWKPLSVDAITAYVERSVDTSIVLRATGARAISCALTTNKSYNTINVNLAPEHLVEENRAAFLRWVQRLAALLPNFFAARASCDSFEISDFYFQNQLPYLPECFNGVLSWFHYFPLATYQRYFSEETLRDAPFDELSFTESKGAAFFSYDSPYLFNTQQAADKIAAISVFLSERQKR